jgi:hypothetical protein
VTYALPADIREAVAPDGNFSGTCAELTDDQLTQHLLRAQSVVDASTGKAYTDTNVPPLLKGLVLALGAYYATLAYRKGKDLAAQDPVYLLYQDAEATLKQIRDGEIDVFPAVNTDTAPSETRPKVINPLLYGVTAFTKEDFGLVIRPSIGGRDGNTIEADLTGGAA